VHLHARDDPSNPVLKCPNITPEEARDIKRLYDTKQKKPAAKPPPPGGGPSLDGIKKVISGAMKDKVTELFARFVFMCILPFAIVEQIWFKEFISDGLGIIYTFPTRKTLAGILLDKEHERVQKKVSVKLGLAN
jgi:hypothetical protein